MSCVGNKVKAASKHTHQKAQKQKKQKTQASHANINDWSSDDSSDAEPATMRDQLKPMSDSSNDDRHAEADAAAAAEVSDKELSVLAAQPLMSKKKRRALHASAVHAESANKADSAKAAPSRQHAGKQSASRKKRKSSTSHRGPAKKTNVDRAQEGSTSQHAKVTDWTSDDSSDAQPEPMPDNLHPMSESDAESQEDKQLRKAAASTHTNFAAARKQVLGTHAQSDTSASPPDGNMLEGEEDRNRAADESISEAQHAKRKSRLRKARAPALSPAQHAAAVPEANDIMVDLEDDLPEDEMEDGVTTVAEAAAKRLPKSQRQQHDSSDKEASHKKKTLRKVLEAGQAAGQGSREQQKASSSKRQHK